MHKQSTASAGSPQGPRGAVCQCPWGKHSINPPEPSLPTGSGIQPEGQPEGLSAMQHFPFRAKCWQTAENPQVLHRFFSLSLNMLLLQNKNLLEKPKSVVIHPSLLSGEPPPCPALVGTQASGQIPDKCKSLEHKPGSIMCPLPNALGKQKRGCNAPMHNT